MQSLPVIVISVGLFIGFSKIDIGCRRIINIISSTTFGVYLIHDNKYIRSFIWDRVFNNAAYADSDLLILYSLYVISSVYICCTLIELLRIRLFENRYMGLVNRVASKIDPFKICPRIK